MLQARLRRGAWSPQAGTPTGIPARSLNPPGFRARSAGAAIHPQGPDQSCPPAYSEAEVEGLPPFNKQITRQMSLWIGARVALGPSQRAVRGRVILCPLVARRRGATFRRVTRPLAP